MVRLPRVVIPGDPHHVTQRGNGRARIFFGDGDYALYIIGRVRRFATAKAIS
jgi:putative transposase